jgi:predicted nuclease with RNAse H fold
MYGGVADMPEAPKLRKWAVTRSSATLVSSLLERSKIRSPRIVGIDLTGSERRATGWSVLNGSHAQTKSIITDDELIRETLAAEPDIVSIDSPLSVPEGWNRAQKQIVPGSPIYRKCELALKRMGISVFWALLPSMQSLTMRGMRLADELRGRGLKVIESYPGAAQDILGIPRKGSSLEELKLGLNRAGIDGNFLKGRVTHDEVDAVTSALVGLFYLADDYIALGTPEEDYLIVPRSSKINYSKLAEILSRTGLDELTAVEAGGVECNLETRSRSVPAFAG